MGKPIFQPTGNDTYAIAYVPADRAEDNHDFASALAQSRRQEREHDFEGACNTRLDSFRRLADMIPDEGETVLEWDDANAQAAMQVAYASGIDHFLVGDWEMAAAILEMLLDIDPEDHLEATIPLAYIYIAMAEYDSFDDIINDVNDKHIDKVILTLWSEFRRTGRLPHGEMVRFRTRFKPYYDEFMADEHPADAAYLQAIRADRPSKEVLARELWLQTEHLWLQFPDFIAALRQNA